jgi:hypothetical protein
LPIRQKIVLLNSKENFDLVEPAYFKIGDEGQAEFAFGVVQAGGEIEYTKTIVFFRWHGFDEGDDITGDGSAELQDDGTLEIEISFDNGDGPPSPRVASDYSNSLLVSLIAV